MTTKHKHEEKPWQPRMDHEPEFNPFANPRDRQLENPMPSEEELEESDRETGERRGNTPAS